MWGNQPDETQALKYKQIDSLRQYFPTVKEISRDALYEVPLTLPSRRIITLRIILPRDFPRVPPQLCITPPVQHKFVDGQANVVPQAHENLLRWTVHASLGKTVYEIVQKFMQEPPQILPQTNGNMSQPSTIVPTSLPVQNPLPVQTPLSSVHTPLPVVPSSFPELDNKSPVELSALLNDETEFNRFFDNLPTVQTMRKVRDDLRANNEDLAKRNLAKEAEIDRMRRHLQEKHSVMNEKRSSFEQKVQRQQEVMKQFSTSSLIEQLNAAALESENQSDLIANEFLAGNIDQKTFIKDFMEKRKLYHLRSAKKESLMMLQR
jgi:hypothetical protein